MRISINKPCHENWDAMTPNQQGAFCLSCQKNVVDFSKKTITEIKEFFTAVPNTEKVCGRFDETQLDELSFDDFFQRFRSWGYVKKAAIVLFFIFGFSLFSQGQPNQQPIKMGAVAYIPQDTVKPICKKDTVQHKQPIKGKVKVNPERPRKQKPEETMHMKGDVMREDDRK